MNPKIVRQIKDIQELEVDFEPFVLNERCPSIRKFPLGTSMQHIFKKYKSSNGPEGFRLKVFKMITI